MNTAGEDRARRLGQWVSEAGNPKHFYGKPCKRKHDGLRYKSKGGCIECELTRSRTPEARAKKRAYYQTPEVRARKSAYSQTPEYRAKQLAYRQVPEHRLKARARSRTPGRRAYARAYNLSFAGREKMRASVFRRRYKISIIDYDRMLEAQNGGCKHCGDFPKTGKPLNVDHCHQTGVVRGLLCNKCNRSIGHLGDDHPSLQRAADYLRPHHATKGA